MREGFSAVEGCDRFGVPCRSDALSVAVLVPFASFVAREEGTKGPLG